MICASERASELLTVCAGLRLETKHRVGGREHRYIVVIAQTAQEVSRLAQRAPNEKIGGDVVGGGMV